jgi:hypothetical protein
MTRHASRKSKAPPRRVAKIDDSGGLGKVCHLGLWNTRADQSKSQAIADCSHDQLISTIWLRIIISTIEIAEDPPSNSICIAKLSPQEKRSLCTYHLLGLA